jgi:uncharacterized protein (UPF0332 family)
MSEREEKVKHLWPRALDSLAACDQMLASSFADFAASRAYYAAFYAASALLLSEGQEYSKHTGVISHLHSDFIRPGRLPAEMGKTLDALSDLRAVGTTAQRST